jgi:hypothetical protein
MTCAYVVCAVNARICHLIGRTAYQYVDLATGVNQILAVEVSEYRRKCSINFLDVIFCHIHYTVKARKLKIG